MRLRVNFFPFKKLFAVVVGIWCAIRKKWKKEKSWFWLLWCKKRRKQKCTCTIQFIPFITLKSVRYNHSWSIKCLEWDSEVPRPGWHSWWKEANSWDNQPSVPSLWQLQRGRGLQRPWGWSSHNITLLYTTSRGNSWTPLVMENSAAPKEADSCVTVIVNKNNTLWWTQFCLSNASTEMTNFWILWSDRIFKPSDNSLQIRRVYF